jgi:hypothetical protein
MKVYLVWMHDAVLAVRPTFRKAENVAAGVMRDPQFGQGWQGWRQSEKGKARWHSDQITRLEIEPRRVA